MGWGATAKTKRIICASASVYDAELKVAQVVSFDMNAIGRQQFNATSPIPPRQLVQWFWQRNVDACPEVEVFGFHFDSPSLIPEARRVFLREVRYARPEIDRDVGAEEVVVDGRIYRRGSEPADAAQVGQLTADYVPTSYARLWASPAGKARLWTIVAELLVEFARALTAPNTVYVVEPPGGGRRTVPADAGAQVCPHNWGEADQKAVAFAVEHEPKTVLVSTIDWDMVIAGCCAFNDRVTVKIARVFQGLESGAIFFSKTGAKHEKSRRVTEYVTPALIGAGSSAWWMLAVGGVDYCDGLVRFGFPAADLSELVPDAAHIVEHGAAGVTVHLAPVFQRLSAIRPVRRKVDSPAEFAAELRRMVFCVLYFCGCGAQAPRGGPSVAGLTFGFAACAGVDDCLDCPPPPFFHPL